MDFGDYVISFLVWFVFPLVMYIAVSSGLYVAWMYGGWLFAGLAYVLGTWIILWMADSIGRAVTVDLSSETLVDRYIKTLKFALPGRKGDQARVREAEALLVRFVSTHGGGADGPMYIGKNAEIEIFPGRILASGDFTQYIESRFGPKWQAWAGFASFMLWPISVPVIFISYHLYWLYRELLT